MEELGNTSRRRFHRATSMLGVGTALGGGIISHAFPDTQGTGAYNQQAYATGIRPFHVSEPEEELVKRRRRIQRTRWPERELVVDASQGVQLNTMRKVADCWANVYDWRRVEARLNSLPQFITEIDGLDIHFIHVRSKHENALPLVVTHGRPGSIIEELKIMIR